MVIQLFIFLLSAVLLWGALNPVEIFSQELPAQEEVEILDSEMSKAEILEQEMSEVERPAEVPAAELTVPDPAAVSTSAIGSAAVDAGTFSIIDELDLKEVEITDVLKMISQKSGLNIVIGSNVVGKVSLYLKNVTPKDVLDIVAKTNDLAYVEADRLVHVMAGADYERIYGRKFFKMTKTILQRLNYISVAEAVPMLERMKSPSGTVLADARSSTISMTDLPENILDMVAFIREIDVPRMTQVFDLNYAKAEDLSERINLILTPTVGSMRFDKRTNKVSVTDIPDKIREIELMIDAFDVKEKQVSIDAKIVQVILSDEFQMGVDWAAIVESAHNLTMTGDFDVLGLPDKGGRMRIGTLDDDQYTAMIEALQTFGQTENLSNPHVMVINNQEAKILVGSSEPYVTSTTTSSASGPNTTAETVNFIEVGVKLYVTPTIHKDGYVTLKIKPEVSSVTRNITTSNNNTIPVVETSEAETTVLVKDGVTIVIGGLIKDEKINTDKRVPFLGDMPLLGAAFRSKDYLTRKTELVIFLTPRVATGGIMDARKLKDSTVSKLLNRQESSEPVSLR